MSNQFDELVFQSAKRHAVSPALIKAIIHAESSFNPMAKRHEANVGDYSYGLMQIRCDTAKWMGYSGDCERLLEPALNVGLGTKFLSFLQGKFPNDTERVIAAYNAGPGRSSRPFINAAYVRRVSSYYAQYRKTEQAEQGRVVTLRPGTPQMGPTPYSPLSPVRVQAGRNNEGTAVSAEAIVPDDKLPWILGGAAVLAFMLLRRGR